MPISSFEPLHPAPEFETEPAGAEVPDLSLVMVVASSSINRVVVTRIAERAGLKAVSTAPTEAEAVLSALRPGAVILDGGADNCECDALIGDLVALRRSRQTTVPAVIFLTTANSGMQRLASSGAVDAVVAKPITPESLQPILLKLIEGRRG